MGRDNPFRYRGYYYDAETGFYYLNSRYYNPEWGRFISADVFVSTGQGLTGANMFAYCGNNPVMYADPSGCFWREIVGFFETCFSEIGKAIGAAAPVYAGCGGAAIADGPLPVGDIIGIVGAGLVTIGAVSYGVYQAVTAPPVSVPQVAEKEEDRVIPLKDKKPIIFPIDPNAFNPIGLQKISRPGTKNGAFVSWMDPLTNVEVFRWDENPNYPNGPHYHIYGNGHYRSGIDTVPEPFALRYFPLR